MNYAVNRWLADWFYYICNQNVNLNERKRKYT